MEWRDLLRNNDLGRYIEPLERYGVETLKHLADEDLLGDDDLRGEEIGMKTLQVVPDKWASLRLFKFIAIVRSSSFTTDAMQLSWYSICLNCSRSCGRDSVVFTLG